MSLKTDDKIVYDLLNDRAYSIPVNQRKYVWEKPKWTELFEDIMIAINNKEHFVGSIVLVREEVADKIQNHFGIIDGQQRIITLTLFIATMAYVYAEKGENEKYDGLKKHLLVRDGDGKYFPIVSNTANKSVSDFIVNLVSVVDESVASHMPLVSIDSIKKMHKMDKQIFNCLQFFYESICDLSVNDIIKIQKAITDTRYIQIIADSKEDAFTIFEILNARGQSLTDFELLKNYIMKNVEDKNKQDVQETFDIIDEQTDKNTDLFLKHYVMHKYGEKPDKEDNRPYKQIVRHEKTTNKIELLLDLLQKSGYYNKIITCYNCSTLEKKIFSFFKPRRQQQFRPLVLGLMHQLELGNLTQEEYDQELEYLYRFFICYNVIGEQTSNKIEDIVYKYSKEIENSFSKEILKTFRTSMGKKLPGKDAFCGKVMNVRYSNHFQIWSGSKKKDNVAAILEVLEKELGFEGDIDDSMTIEHILPDSCSEDNSVIGNMMLLEDNYNQLCKNKEIKDKLQYYQQSQLKLPAKFIGEYESDDFDINKRTLWIAEFLYNYINKESYLQMISP